MEEYFLTRQVSSTCSPAAPGPVRARALCKILEISRSCVLLFDQAYVRILSRDILRSIDVDHMRRSITEGAVRANSAIPPVDDMVACLEDLASGRETTKVHLLYAMQYTKMGSKSICDTVNVLRNMASPKDGIPRDTPFDIHVVGLTFHLMDTVWPHIKDANNDTVLRQWIAACFCLAWRFEGYGYDSVAIVSQMTGWCYGDSSILLQRMNQVLKLTSNTDPTRRSMAFTVQLNCPHVFRFMAVYRTMLPTESWLPALYIATASYYIVDIASTWRPSDMAIASCVMALLLTQDQTTQEFCNCEGAMRDKVTALISGERLGQFRDLFLTKRPWTRELNESFGAIAQMPAESLFRAWRNIERWTEGASLKRKRGLSARK